ncbi:MAG: DNA adenine methylase [bacterium]
MKYMGSKNRIAKFILPIMLKYHKSNQYWVEPFVGGGNMIDKVSGMRIGADNNPWVIDALIAIRDDVDLLPKNNREFTEDDYKALKLDDSYPFKGYAGFAFSYGGKWMGGWRRDKIGKRDYVNESYKNALKQSPLLQGVELVKSSYRDLNIPNNSLIYCDPPYANTTKYKSKFNHSEFFEWCRIKSGEGHTVFVSEYNAPDDFECLWSKQIPSSLTRNTGSKTGIEKLFICKI